MVAVTPALLVDALRAVRGSNALDALAQLRRRHGLTGDDQVQVSAALLLTEPDEGVRESLADLLLGRWVGGNLSRCAVFLIKLFASEPQIRALGPGLHLDGVATVPVCEKLLDHVGSIRAVEELAGEEFEDDAAGFMLARYVSTSRTSGASRAALKDYEHDAWAVLGQVLAPEDRLNDPQRGDRVLEPLLH